MSTELPIDHHIAEYRIMRLIGRGGMGVVYLAEHTQLGRKVALKVLPPEYAEDEGFRDRFHREARMAASLDHPNIVPVYDAGEHEGRLWIAMRYVVGTDLRTMLDEGPGELHPLRAVSILGRVASALDAAHGRGLVHRDVKPGNILLEPPSQENPVERVYLTDFGLTKEVDAADIQEEVPKGVRQITKTGFFVGTLDYAAPEQFQGKHLDGRTDEYALACVLYECLTGRIPYSGESEAAVMFAHLTELPPRVSARRAGLAPGLDSIVAKGMAKDRDARYPTCGAMIHAARAAISGAPTQPVPGSAPSFAPSQPSYAPSQPSYAPPQPSRPSYPPQQPSQPSQPSFPPAEPAVPERQTSFPPPQPSQPSFPPQQPEPSHAPQPSQGPPMPTHAAPTVGGAPLHGATTAPQPSGPVAPPSFTHPSVPGPPPPTYAPGGPPDGGFRKSLPWVIAGVVMAVIIVIVVLVAVGGKKPGPTPSASGTPPPAAVANHQIAFESARGGSGFDIFVMNDDGTGQRKLTTSAAEDQFPAWSPDFKQIAFSSDRDGNKEIFVMNADGSNVRRITTNSADDDQPAWSPDGKRIAFFSSRGNNGDIYSMNADGSDVRRLTNDPAVDAMPAFSHDGARIAFGSKRDGNFEIYVMNADGTGQTRLTTARGEDGFPAFSPDDTKIAFHTQRDGNFEIYVMNADGSAQTRITHSPGDDFVPTWSTDGKQIAFMGNRNDNLDIFVINADGSGETRLTTDPGPDSFPRWSSD